VGCGLLVNGEAIDRSVNCADCTKNKAFQDKIRESTVRAESERQQAAREQIAFNGAGPIKTGLGGSVVAVGFIFLLVWLRDLGMPDSWLMYALVGFLALLGLCVLLAGVGYVMGISRKKNASRQDDATSSLPDGPRVLVQLLDTGQKKCGGCGFIVTRYAISCKTCGGIFSDERSPHAESGTTPAPMASNDQVG
jgi:hypothetical protein